MRARVAPTARGSGRGPQPVVGYQDRSLGSLGLGVAQQLLGRQQVRTGSQFAELLGRLGVPLPVLVVGTSPE